jgi:hypothetical protein
VSSESALFRNAVFAIFQFNANIQALEVWCQCFDRSHFLLGLRCRKRNRTAIRARRSKRTENLDQKESKIGFSGHAFSRHTDWCQKVNETEKRNCNISEEKKALEVRGGPRNPQIKKFSQLRKVNPTDAYSETGDQKYLLMFSENQYDPR